MRGMHKSGSKQVSRRLSNDLPDVLRKAGGGRLNPEFVEWLMGWPLGWTDLKPLVTDKFREWRQQHGDFSKDG